MNGTLTASPDKGFRQAVDSSISFKMTAKRPPARAVREWIICSEVSPPEIQIARSVRVKALQVDVHLMDTLSSCYQDQFGPELIKDGQQDAIQGCQTFSGTKVLFG